MARYAGFPRNSLAIATNRHPRQWSNLKIIRGANGTRSVPVTWQARSACRRRARILKMYHDGQSAVVVSQGGGD